MQDSVRHTKSICHACGAITKATTHDIYISYACSSCGTEHTEVVEIDREFFDTFGYGRHTDVYKSLLLPITWRCNEVCKLCYAPRGLDKPLDWCLDTINKYKSRSIWLSGGEPTIHPQFFNLVATVPRITSTLTNGKEFADIRFMEEYVSLTGTDCDTVKIALSLHSDIAEYKYHVLENVRLLGLKLSCAMFSITDISELAELLCQIDMYSDIIQYARIRTPFNSWKQPGVKTLYLSQLYNAIKQYSPDITVSDIGGGNSIFNVNIFRKGTLIALCSAPSPTAMDIDACKNAPYTIAENGKIYPVPVAWVMNEHTHC